MHFYTMLDANIIYAIIESRRKELGLTQAQVSMRAFNRSDTSALQNIRRGSSPSAEKLEAISRALELEFYFGPTRNTEADKKTEIDGEKFDAVPRYDAMAAAGEGAFNLDAPPIDHLAFSKTWLKQNGIRSETCILLTVKGDSMEPSIYGGDLVMIDRQRRNIVSGKIYAFVDGDRGARIKRLEVIPEKAIIIRSDNPNEPVEYRANSEMSAISEGIIGEVIWSGHTW